MLKEILESTKYLFCLELGHGEAAGAVVAFTRRKVLSSLAASLGAVAAGASQLGGAATATAADEMPGMDHDPASGEAHSGHAGFAQGGVVDSAANGFDPSLIVRDFDWGRMSKLPDGRTLREWELVAGDKEIEIAPGVKYAAWTFNGRVPGPTLRCVDGDRLRVRFSNGSAHPHTVHFHGIHPSQMDGVPGLGEEIGGGLIQPGQSFTYEFDAGPFGLHLYHCHASPLAAHIAKGLYGMFIVDPKEPRAQADELVMVMNAFDTNFDFGNEIYAVNTVGFHYLNSPIKVKRDALVRIYLVNVLEYDPINSFHLHANFFHYFPTGTSLVPAEYTDTISQVQGQRGILELKFPYPGKYMFHAHKTEFAELGWMGFFEVEDR
jgi:FtsP/CotA-like multicopper oxidase with cupredoxin domain